jgi:SAM-dependent methyltransferase
VALDAERDVVRLGYDALSYRYRDDDAPEGHYAPWLADLRDRLPSARSVLDLGCGCGVPVARSLAAAGYQVTGVDISDVQIDRARRLVPPPVSSGRMRAHWSSRPDLSMPSFACMPSFTCRWLISRASCGESTAGCGHRAGS